MVLGWACCLFRSSFSDRDSVGSMLAVLGMPLTAVAARGEIEKVLCSFPDRWHIWPTFFSLQTQAWIFLVGSLAGTLTTVCFIYVLFRFPAFIRHVREGGAEPDIVVRLAIFYSLNVSNSFQLIIIIPKITSDPANTSCLPLYLHYSLIHHRPWCPLSPLPYRFESVSIQFPGRQRRF